MDVKERALEAHEKWAGKIEVVARCEVNSKDDLSIAYTPGVAEPCLKIKDDPSFRAEFIGKKVNVASDPVFSVVKVGTSADENSSVDAITGATMTSKGLGEAIAFWLKAYAPFLSSAAPAKECCGGNGGECDGSKPCCSESSEAGCCSDSSAVKCPVTE